jgi:hypothetical protein
MPRATTAAWLVMPPRAVRMPLRGVHAVMSSGLVSMRTRMTFSPLLGAPFGLVGMNTIALTAPGRPAGPRSARRACALGSSVGCSSWSSAAGSTRSDRLLAR